MSALDSVTDVLEGPQQVLGQSSGQVVRLSAGQELQLKKVEMRLSSRFSCIHVQVGNAAHDQASKQAQTAVTC